MNDTVVIYHADCVDGFCAAWIAWRKFGADAEYLPAYYGQEPPDVTGKDVYVLDFSYPREMTLRLLDQAARCVVLDHHRTAEADLSELIAEPHKSPHLVVFDMNLSGAGLARNFFDAAMSSWLVDYVQDRDLWRFELPRSKQVNAYISTLPLSFEKWDEVHRVLSANEAASLGIGAEAYKNMYVEKMAKHAQRVTFAGHPDIPIVNASYVGISELVGALAETALFAVGWFQRGDGRVVFSLRSRGDFDVAELAKQFGGGGHRGAAGFTLELPIHSLIPQIGGVGHG